MCQGKEVVASLTAISFGTPPSAVPQRLPCVFVWVATLAYMTRSVRFHSATFLPDAFAVGPSTVGTAILYECLLDILG